MRITELLSKESSALGIKVASKDAAIDYLVNLHDAAGNISDKKTYKEGILKREEEGSTAIGEGNPSLQEQGSQETWTCSYDSSRWS